MTLKTILPALVLAAFLTCEPYQLPWTVEEFAVQVDGGRPEYSKPRNNALYHNVEKFLDGEPHYVKIWAIGKRFVTFPAEEILRFPIPPKPPKNLRQP